MYLQELYSPGLPKNTCEYRRALLPVSLPTLGSPGEGHSLPLHHLPETREKYPLAMYGSYVAFHW